MIDPAVKTATVLCILLGGVCAATLLRPERPKLAVAEPSPPTKPAHISGGAAPVRETVLRPIDSPIPPAAPFSAPTPPPRLHTVVDGDALPDLARRYLGSADRARDIFAANRDVLSDPQLLPIGVQLKIPAQ
jgi:nucleoid-associated protein YgaU